MERRTHLSYSNRHVHGIGTHCTRVLTLTTGLITKIQGLDVVMGILAFPGQHVFKGIERLIVYAQGRWPAGFHSYHMWKQFCEHFQRAFPDLEEYNVAVHEADVTPGRYQKGVKLFEGPEEHWELKMKMPEWHNMRPIDPAVVEEPLDLHDSIKYRTAVLVCTPRATNGRAGL